MNQSYGTGIAGSVRGYRAYQSQKSKDVWLKWNNWFKKYRLTLGSPAKGPSNLAGGRLLVLVLVVVLLLPELPADRLSSNSDQQKISHCCEKAEGCIFSGLD